MTGQDVVDVVRGTVYDEDEPYRFSDALMIRWLNLGQLYICRERPDALFDADGSALTVTSITVLSGTLAIDEDWQEALVEYMQMRCFETEGKDRKDRERAKEHRAALKALLTA